MPLPRTDLAIAATQLFNEQQTGEIPGVAVTEDTIQGFPVTQVEITSPEGAEAVGKPQGRYLTLDLNGLLRREADAFPRAAQALARELTRLLPEDEGLSAEYFEKAYGPIQELYAKSRDDDSAAGRKRSAALAWVLIDFSYNNATGSCAKWVLYAERLGLLEAHRIVADPPEKLRGYLLPPERQ